MSNLLVDDFQEEEDDATEMGDTEMGDVPASANTSFPDKESDEEEEEGEDDEMKDVKGKVPTVTIEDYWKEDPKDTKSIMENKTFLKKLYAHYDNPYSYGNEPNATYQNNFLPKVAQTNLMEALESLKKGAVSDEAKLYFEWVHSVAKDSYFWTKKPHSKRNGGNEKSTPQQLLMLGGNPLHALKTLYVNRHISSTPGKTNASSGCHQLAFRFNGAVKKGRSETPFTVDANVCSLSEWLSQLRMEINGEPRNGSMSKMYPEITKDHIPGPANENGAKAAVASFQGIRSHHLGYDGKSKVTPPNGWVMKGDPIKLDGYRWSVGIGSGPGLYNSNDIEAELSEVKKGNRIKVELMGEGSAFEERKLKMDNLRSEMRSKELNTCSNVDDAIDFITAAKEFKTGSLEITKMTNHDNFKDFADRMYDVGDVWMEKWRKNMSPSAMISLLQDICAIIPLIVGHTATERMKAQIDLLSLDPDRNKGTLLKLCVGDYIRSKLNKLFVPELTDNVSLNVPMFAPLNPFYMTRFCAGETQLDTIDDAEDKLATAKAEKATYIAGNAMVDDGEEDKELTALNVSIAKLEQSIERTTLLDSPDLKALGKLQDEFWKNVSPSIQDQKDQGKDKVEAFKAKYHIDQTTFSLYEAEQEKVNIFFNAFETTGCKQVAQSEDPTIVTLSNMFHNAVKTGCFEMTLPADAKNAVTLDTTNYTLIGMMKKNGVVITKADPPTKDSKGRSIDVHFVKKANKKSKSGKRGQKYKSVLTHNSVTPVDQAILLPHHFTFTTKPIINIYSNLQHDYSLLEIFAYVFKMIQDSKTHKVPILPYEETRSSVKQNVNKKCYSMFKKVYVTGWIAYLNEFAEANSVSTVDDDDDSDDDMVDDEDDLAKTSISTTIPKDFKDVVLENLKKKFPVVDGLGGLLNLLDKKDPVNGVAWMKSEILKMLAGGDFSFFSVQVEKLKTDLDTYSPKGSKKKAKKKPKKKPKRKPRTKRKPKKVKAKKKSAEDPINETISIPTSFESQVLKPTEKKNPKKRARGDGDSGLDKFSNSAKNRKVGPKGDAVPVVIDINGLSGAGGSMTSNTNTNKNDKYDIKTITAGADELINTDVSKL